MKGVCEGCFSRARSDECRGRSQRKAADDVRPLGGGILIVFPSFVQLLGSRKRVVFYTPYPIPTQNPPPPPPPAETFAVLGVNSGVKQNITASTHSFDGYCNLRICACFFSGVALRSSVER